jgi:hypothetical protein
MKETFTRLLLEPWVILTSWLVYSLFFAFVLPAEAEKIDEMGLTESIDTNFSFDPSSIYPIVEGYGVEGRAFYIRRRWTFDLVFPLVYGSPFWLTLNKFLPMIPFLEKFKAFANLALIAVAFDYLENIVFTILIVLYPTEISFLPVIGVTMSFIKWLSLSLVMPSTLVVSIIVLVEYVSDAIFGVNEFYVDDTSATSPLNDFVVVF